MVVEPALAAQCKPALFSSVKLSITMALSVSALSRRVVTNGRVATVKRVVPCAVRQRAATTKRSAAPISEDEDQLDVNALLKYAGAIPLQTGIMTGALAVLGAGANALQAAQDLPGGVEGAIAAKVRTVSPCVCCALVMIQQRSAAARLMHNSML